MPSPHDLREKAQGHPSLSVAPAIYPGKLVFFPKYIVIVFSFPSSVTKVEYYWDGEGITCTDNVHQRLCGPRYIPRP